MANEPQNKSQLEVLSDLEASLDRCFEELLSAQRISVDIESEKMGDYIHGSLEGILYHLSNVLQPVSYTNYLLGRGDIEMKDWNANLDNAIRATKINRQYN